MHNGLQFKTYINLFYINIFYYKLKFWTHSQLPKCWVCFEKSAQ